MSASALERFNDLESAIRDLDRRIESMTHQRESLLAEMHDIADKITSGELSTDYDVLVDTTAKIFVADSNNALTNVGSPIDERAMFPELIFSLQATHNGLGEQTEIFTSRDYSAHCDEFLAELGKVCTSPVNVVLYVDGNGWDCSEHYLFVPGCTREEFAASIVSRY